mmetsp:Transcript_66481/g.191918  ORF Transcript_66481/g.191918 Transcript_66481/m.191918 type:complete len:483 (+) Transcript_66481:95-1543(+)
MAEDSSQQQQAKPQSGFFWAFLHHQVQFFAYWFGSSRFDEHGRGGFDADDIKAYLADQGFLWKTKDTVWKGHGLAAESANSNSTILGMSASTENAGKAESIENEAGTLQTWTGHEDIDANDGNAVLPPGKSAETLGAGVDEERSFHKWRRWYITIYSAVVFFMWLIAVIVKLVSSDDSDVDAWQTKGGLDSLAEGQTDLRLSSPRCVDTRSEVWRLWTYQFTHIGAMQVFINCLLNFVSGTLLEATHGWLITALVFQMGVIGGALFWAVNDAHTVSVGCVGGCYAMIGMHLADLTLNIRRKNYRVMLFVMIIAMVVADVLAGRGSLEADYQTLSPQIGGAFIGVVVGAVVVLNKLKPKEPVAESTGNDAIHPNMYRESKPWWQRGVQALCVLIALGFIGYCSYFIAVVQEDGPINLAESSNGDSPWCWVGQFWNDTIDEYNWRCLRCYTGECIARWENSMQFLMPVKLTFCEAGDAFWYIES